MLVLFINRFNLGNKCKKRKAIFVKVLILKRYAMNSEKILQNARFLGRGVSKWIDTQKKMLRNLQDN